MIKKTGLAPSYEGLLRHLVLTRLRIVGGVGAVLILIFSKLDTVVYPAYWSEFLLIRACMSASFLFVIALSFTALGRRFFFILSDIMIFLAGFGISLMIYISDGSASDYYEGLNLTFLGMFAVNSFRPLHHVLTGITVLACYIWAATTNPHPFEIGQFASGLFFMSSTLLFVALTAKFYGRQHYEQFLTSEEIKTKNKKLDEAYQKLRENEKLKDEFFANVSHELRTPLTLILSPLESLISDLPGPKNSGPETRNILETLRRNATRLLQMINGLLDFSKLEAGKMQVHRQALDIVSATQVIVDDFMPSVRQKGLSLSFQPAVAEAYVQMDHYFYDRILFNLISNAVKFTDHGGIIIRLEIHGSQLTFTIQDTGPGIAQGEIPRLFEKFHQIEGAATRRFEGTGLGLAMVKEFVTLLNGNISVSSEPGQGTRFSVICYAPPALKHEAVKAAEQLPKRFPVFLPSQRLEEVSATALSSGKNDPLKKSKILVAEDNEELAAYISSLVEPLAEIRFAENGKKALQIATTWHPDLILSDIMMPELDGLQLTREIKKDEVLNSITVVLLTALTHREALLKGWEAGADEYLFKPFHPTELVTRIQSLLHSISLRREIERRLLQQTEESTRLRTELEQLELFSFVASHDLQEPLHRLLTLSSILKHTQTGRWNAEQEDYFKTIDESVKQMQQYLRDILKYARAGTTGVLDFHPVDLNEVLITVRKELKDTIAASNARVEAEALPVIHSDPIQMEQLFKNLIGNAVKFHRPNVVPEIKIRYQETDDMHILYFEDNGIGLDEKYAGDIFKPFFRLKKNKTQGSGIGLAICQKIVWRHGGQISVHSKPGQGATFEVKLPKDPALKKV